MHMPMLNVTLVDDDDALAALQPEWRAFVGDVPFHELSWMHCWWTSSS